MNYENRLKELNTEDFIWVIYIVIIFMSWYSNNLERNYFLYHDSNSKESYSKIIMLIFSILLIIYLYFFKNSLESINELSINDSLKKVKLTKLSAIASLLIVISGLIYLYIAYTDYDIDTEIAFN